VTVDRGSRCPVCGQAVQDQGWSCERCSTPHHDDCVQYFGGCAIFGCRDGLPPQPLEVKTWPLAFRLLRTLLQVRRFQGGVLIAFGISMLAMSLVPIFLGSGAATHPLFILTVAIMSGSGLGYLLIDATFGDILTRWLKREMGPERAAGLQLARSRVRQAIPRLGDDAGRFAWLSRTGTVSATLGTVLFVLGLVFRAPWLIGALATGVGMMISGLVLVTIAQQLEVHAAHLRLSLHRFEASYAPPLPKPAKALASSP
jgi:hypothetical protein